MARLAGVLVCVDYMLVLGIDSVGVVWLLPLPVCRYSVLDSPGRKILNNRLEIGRS